MRKLLVISLLIIGCKKKPSVTCSTCTVFTYFSYEYQGAPPPFMDTFKSIVCPNDTTSFLRDNNSSYEGGSANGQYIQSSTATCK